MRRALWLILLVLTGLSLPLPAAAQEATLYHLVTGGEQDYRVKERPSLTYLARTLGLRPWVLSRQTKLKVNTRLKPGTVLKVDTSHIVPTELSHGLVINLPEPGLSAPLCPGGGQKILAHPHWHLPCPQQKAKSYLECADFHPGRDGGYGQRSIGEGASRSQ
jgi:hypothetical protein